MLINELLNKDTYIVPEEYPLNILDSKSDVCMDKNGKDTKHTRKLYRGGTIYHNKHVPVPIAQSSA